VNGGGKTASQRLAWEAVLGSLGSVFGRPSWAIFSMLMTGWVLCTGRRTVVGVYQQADPVGRRSHDAYHRFIRCGAWKPEELWRTLATAMMGRLAPDGMIEIDMDDTLLHRTGRKVAGAGLWRDAVRSFGKRIVIAWGLNVLVVTLRIRAPWGGEPLGLPIWVALHRKDGPKLTELATQALITITSWFPGRRVRCCADGAYASTLMSIRIPDLVTVSRLQRNAALYGLKPPPTGRRGRPRQRGDRIGTPTSIAKRARTWITVSCDQRGQTVTKLVHARALLWYSVSKHPVQLVIVRDPEGHEPDDFFICSDLTLTPAEVASAYAGRWSIEDTFRATKQSIHVQQPQSWAGAGPERVAGLGFLLYSLVWWWFLSLPPNDQQVRPTAWFTRKATPSFADALAALRTMFWRERIFPNSDPGPINDEILDSVLDALARAA
jgi:hypothetical protein